MMEGGLNLTEIQNIEEMIQEESYETYEAEMSLLGSIILEPGILPEVLEIVTVEDFQKPVHRSIFSVMETIHLGGLHPDRVMLWQTLQSRGISSPPEIAEIISFVPCADYWREYAGIIRKKRAAQKLRQIGIKLSKIELPEVEKSIVAIETEIVTLREKETPDKEYSVRGVTSGLLEEVAGDRAETNRVVTGFIDIDKLCPLRKGDYVVLAGRPSMGKTTLAFNIVENILNRESVEPVLIFTYEMSAQAALRKIVLSQLRIPTDKYYSNYLSNTDNLRIQTAIEAIEKTPLYLCDEFPRVNRLVGLATKIAQRVQRECNQPLSLVVVDYIQKIRLDEVRKGYSRDMELGIISSALKKLAVSLEVPVLCISQLNREVERRDNKRPLMSDLRESGNIEQDADSILMLYRDEYYYPKGNNRHKPEMQNKVEIRIVKQRHGKAGFTVWLNFPKDPIHFVSAASENHYDDEVPF